MVEGRRFDEAAAETASRDSISPARAKERIAGGSALHRVSAPADIANMVRFLAGEAARQITGQDLVVDGGWAI
jgi:NAD(P)-dependent dehydrogenase (short-subunit alcohol dehydrogenase family)